MRKAGANEESTVAARVFVGFSAVVIATCLIVIVMMLLGALAFAQTIDTGIPLVVAFDGYTDASGTNAMRMSGSWIGFAALVGIVSSLIAWAGVRALAGKSARVG